jgi:hypothetical protein
MNPHSYTQLIFDKGAKDIQWKIDSLFNKCGWGKWLSACRKLNRTTATQQLRERMDKLDYMKLKSFCTTKEMVSKLKRPPTEWEKIFANFTSDKPLVTDYIGSSKN